MLIKSELLSSPIHLIWIAGASCDGCSMSMLGSSRPPLEDLLAGRTAAGKPVAMIHPLLAMESGEEYRAQLDQAARGGLDPYILVLEGSVMDEAKAGEGSFSRLGTDEGRPVTTSNWLHRLAPGAEAVVAIGSCATWGGIPAAEGNPTGATGLEDYMGRRFRSRAGLPIVNVPGCAPSGEGFIETIIYVILHLKGSVTLELDEERRPQWLYSELVQLTPPRTGDGGDVPSPDLFPSVHCPVPRRGWMNGIGGCGHVGGACIGCTARDFADVYLEKARPHY